MSINNSQACKYKSALVGKTSNVKDGESFVKDTKTVVPLKYFSNLWRSLEMSLINCKVHLEINSLKDCFLSSAGNSAKFKITDAKLYVTKQLSEGFKRSVYWNSYLAKPEKEIEKGKNLYKLHNASFQVVRRLFVLAYVVAAGAANDEADIKDNEKYFIPGGEINNYIALIDGRNFYDQSINDLIKQYDEARKVSTGQSDDYTTHCLLDYAYFNDDYRLTAVDLRKKKALDADQRGIQPIVFQGVVGDDNKKIRLYTILEQSKETVLEF